jgi:hypothetical protein
VHSWWYICFEWYLSKTQKDSSLLLKGFENGFEMEEKKKKRISSPRRDGLLLLEDATA